LPTREQNHRHDADEAQQVEKDPLGARQKPDHEDKVAVWNDEDMCPTPSDLPDFRIPHAEKIEWMIETKGWAIEPVAADPEAVPPMPGYSYTIGLPERHEFPEIVVFGLKPVAISGMLDMIVEQLGSGVEIPLDTELVGLFDNDLRCFFLSVDVTSRASLFRTGVAWHAGENFPMVQLLWPDRNGWMPYESGFDTAVRTAQPVLGRVEGSR
jgi:hypothetical protein